MDVSPIEQLREAITAPRELSGLVERILTVCQEHGLQIDWKNDKCHVRTVGGTDETIIETPQTHRAFRSILARIAVLVQNTGAEFKPYGNSGKFPIGNDPAKGFDVKFVNTPAEQRLELTPITLEPGQQPKKQGRLFG
jgi:hypothetical protein